MFYDMNEIEHSWLDIKDESERVMMHELASVHLATERQVRYRLNAVKVKASSIDLLKIAETRNSKMLILGDYSEKR